MRGPFKSQSLNVLRERNIPVSTILDVGVLNGTPELIQVFKDIKHILFEPVVEFREKIIENYSGVAHELHNFAVSSSSGEAFLALHSRVEGMEISHSGMVSDPRSAKITRTVPMTSIDDFLEKNPQTSPYLLKIDIDGQELSFVAGAKKTLPLCSVVIIEATKSSLVDRMNAISSAGFELFDIVEPCYYDDSFWQCDLIFIRSDLQREHFLQLTDKVVSGKYTMFK